MNKELEAYFDAIPEERRGKIISLHQLVFDLYPEADADMSYRMPTYRRGDGWVALANQKNYISLYTCGYHHIENFKTRHPDIKTGKGCINFRDRDDLPMNEIKAVIRHAIEQPKA